MARDRRGTSGDFDDNEMGVVEIGGDASRIDDLQPAWFTWGCVEDSWDRNISQS